eukprot:Rmarinus@m.29830
MQRMRAAHRAFAWKSQVVDDERDGGGDESLARDEMKAALVEVEAAGKHVSTAQEEVSVALAKVDATMRCIKRQEGVADGAEPGDPLVPLLTRLEHMYSGDMVDYTFQVTDSGSMTISPNRGPLMPKPRRLAFDTDDNLWAVMDSGDVIVFSLLLKKSCRVFSVEELGQSYQTYGFACFDSGPTTVLTTAKREYRYNTATGNLDVRTFEWPLIEARIIAPLPDRGALYVPRTQCGVFGSDIPHRVVRIVERLDKLCVTPDGKTLVTLSRKGTISTYAWMGSGHDLSNVGGTWNVVGSDLKNMNLSCTNYIVVVSKGKGSEIGIGSHFISSYDLTPGKGLLGNGKKGFCPTGSICSYVFSVCDNNRFKIASVRYQRDNSPMTIIVTA